MVSYKALNTGQLFDIHEINSCDDADSDDCNYCFYHATCNFLGDKKTNNNGNQTENII